MTRPASDIAFTPAVKAIQTQKGSRASYARMESHGGWRTKVTEDLAGFLAGLDMFYLGTANREGQPYIQYRGGPLGFSKSLTSTRSALLTSVAIDSTSRSVIFRRIPRRSCS